MDTAIASVTTPPGPAPRPVEPARRVEPAPQAAGPSGDRNPSSTSDEASKAADAAAAQRSFERDAETGSLVYRLVDLASGIVTIQTPSDARLKLRAYIDGVTAANDQSAGVEVRA